MKKFTAEIVETDPEKENFETTLRLEIPGYKEVNLSFTKKVFSELWLENCFQFCEVDASEKGVFLNCEHVSVDAWLSKATAVRFSEETNLDFSLESDQARHFFFFENAQQRAAFVSKHIKKVRRV